MHDGQIEDRVRAVLRARGEALPLTITAEELERRLALRRRERLSRRAGRFAAGLAIVAIGSLLAASSGWFRPAGVGTGPSASASVSPTDGPSVEPSGSTLSCDPIDPAALDGPPGLLMGTSPGDAKAYGGLRSSYRLGDRQVGKEGTWDHDTIYIEPVAAGFPTERLQVLASNPDACLTALQVDAVPTEQPGDPPVRIAEVTSDPVRVIEFAKPPVGDWFVRVRADFATTSGTTAWAETFFAIVVPDCVPLDPASAAAPPAIGAGVVPGDSLGHDGVQVASVWNGQVVGSPGTWDGLPAEPDQIAPNFDYEALQIVSDACMFDVRAEALLTVYGEVPDPAPTPIQLQVLRGAGSHAVDIDAPPTGGWDVRVRASFPTIDGSEASSETLFRVMTQFNAPGLTMGPDFFEVMGQAGCPSYHLNSGASAADACGGSYELVEGREPVPVMSGAPLIFKLEDGWVIDEARVVAVDAELVARGEFAPEYSVSLQENVGATLSVPIALDPGPWILRITLNGSRQGDNFGAHYDIAVTVTP